MILGNEETVQAFKAWIKQWTLKKKPTKACLLVGPPGVGKTTLTRAAANDHGFRVLEMNASDVRTEKAIKNILTPATASSTLDVFSTNSRGNLVLLDEVDGVFGREDRGGLGAILSAIKGSPLPIVLTANNIDDDKFDDLKRACAVLRMYEIRPRLLVSLTNFILSEENRSLPASAVRRLAFESRGDLRSAINDLQTLATSNISTLHSNRTRELDERDTVQAIFAARGVTESRRALNETEIPLYTDALLLLIHDLLPYIYRSRDKLAKAYDALSHADIGYGRVGASRSRGRAPPPFNLPRRDRPPEWSLLPNALNELATVGLQEPDEDVTHAFEVAPRISSKIIDRFQYRLWELDHLCGRIARVCHLSKRKVLQSVIPTLVEIFRRDEEQGRKIAAQLECEEIDIDFLTTESKAQPAPGGPAELLDPNGFKLPFMGKDKFIQIMRAGISYDRNAGKFAVRRLDSLDTVEERLAGILSRPVKFARPGQQASVATETWIQICYVDGRQVLCDKCEFLDACPTHVISELRYCLCDDTFGDPKSYEKYIAKNLAAPKATSKTIKPEKRVPPPRRP